MSWTTVARRLFHVAVVLLFVGSLVAIVVTGPVVVRRSKLDLKVDVSAERLRRDVEKLVSEFSPRHYERVDNLDRAAEWIAGEFAAAGLQVELQDYELREGRFRNVIGFRAGLDGEAPVRVVGAHYDAYGPYPGADDNASGVAVLLELVRTLPPEPPRRNQYFVAFSTEEPPFFGTDGMGSFVFADRLRREGVAVDLMVALDVVGYFSDQPGSQRAPLPGMGLLYPRRGNFIAVVGDLSSGRSIKRVKQYLMSMSELPVRSFRGPRRVAHVDWSDHAPFRELGMPAVLITDTAFLRNAGYHTRHDTPDKLDYPRMAGLVRGLHAVVWDRDVSG